MSIKKINSYEVAEDIFKEKLNFITNQIEKDLKYANNLEDILYFELSKKEIITFFNESLCTLKKWQQYLDEKNIKNIRQEYKELEGTISELELCLADHDETFKLDVVAYSLYEIGKLLIERNDN